MSSSEIVAEEEETKILFEAVKSVSTIDPPIEEWSSLQFEIPEGNVKRLLYSEGLYEPGSGEICLKYIAQSQSSILRHPYFNYPAILDPGIYKALLAPEDKIIYPDDGQELYLAACKEMKQHPCRVFHRGLLEDNIDLRYYCVSPNGVRAMSLALQYNRSVKALNLTESFLSQDSCFHLGDMLSKNSFLCELNLSGCRIGPFGLLRLLAGLETNRALKKLVLDKNQLGDEGGEILAQAIFKGIDLKQIGLSYNNLDGGAAQALADAFETHNKFTHIDLSWNNLFTPLPTFALLSMLSENVHLTEINLSWNGLTGYKTGIGIKKLLNCPLLKRLDLSHNTLKGDAVNPLIKVLPKAKSLLILDLSFNPIPIASTLLLINQLTLKTVKLQKLFLEEVDVDEEFLEVRSAVLAMSSRKNAVITYGRVVRKFIPQGTDPRVILLKRADVLAMKPKKNKIDIVLWCMQKLKDGNETLSAKSFGYWLRKAGCPIDMDLIDAITDTFLAYRTAKDKFINMVSLVDFMTRLWPDRHLPPTPPPPPEPKPVKKKKGKGKK